MKAVLVLIAFLAVIALSSAVYSHNNGQPICTQANVAESKFRHNFDPTQYWLCYQVNIDAAAVRCPDQTGFLNSLKECVDWKQWVWEEPYDPPTD